MKSNGKLERLKMQQWNFVDANCAAKWKAFVRSIFDMMRGMRRPMAVTETLRFFCFCSIVRQSFPELVSREYYGWRIQILNFGRGEKKHAHNVNGSRWLERADATFRFFVVNFIINIILAGFCSQKFEIMFLTKMELHCLSFSAFI